VAISVVDSTKKASAAASTTLETDASDLTVSGSDTYLLAWVMTGAGTPVAPSAVKWGGSGGTSLSQIGSTVNCGANGKLSLWGLTAPTAQSSTVHVTWGSSQDERVIIAASFSGVDQGTPLGTSNSGTGTNHAPTVAVTSVSGDLVVDGTWFVDSSANSWGLTKDASQTLLQGFGGGVISIYEDAGASSEVASGTSTTMSWTISGSGGAPDWGVIGVAVKSGGSGPKRLMTLGAG